MKKIILSIFLFLTLWLNAQITTTPTLFNATSTGIVLNFNKTGTLLSSYSGTIYAHIGVTVNGSTWQYVKGSWGNNTTQPALTSTGANTYALSFGSSTNLYQYFGVPTSSTITQICVVLRNALGTAKNSNSDTFISLEAFQASLTIPVENNTAIVNSGANYAISASNTGGTASYNLVANGTSINTYSGANYSFTATNLTSNKYYDLQISQGSISYSKKFTVIVSPGTNSLALPVNVEDGINYNTSDPTKATLVLTAPGKDFVYVAGSFNNWQPTSAHAMKKDPTTGKFWLELTGLTSGATNSYQYWVVDQTPTTNSPSLVKTADPFSALVLSPFDDQWNPSGNYPNLPPYPAGQEREVTVLQTGQTPYNWSAANSNFVKPEKDNLVVYEVLVRDFDANKSFQNLIDRIDYFKNLKINAIQLMPVMEFEGTESWGYNTAFHMALDKAYGTASKLKEFIDLCHQNGIAVILDVALNHAFGRNPLDRMWMTDPDGDGWGGPAIDNPYLNTTATHSYNVGYDFNHQSAYTKYYVKRVIKHWIQEFKIDGFRWDLTKGFTQNCTGSDSCTDDYQQDRVDVLKEYADYSWELDASHYVIFEHLGIDNEEQQWANYRIGETPSKGIMLWGEMTSAYSQLLMGYNSNNDISRMGNTAHDFVGRRVIGYPESHDKERLMYSAATYGNSSNASHNVKTLAIALGRMSAIGAVSLLVPGPKMIWDFAELGNNRSIFSCNNGTVNTDFDAASGDCKLDTKQQFHWTNNWLGDLNRNKIYTDWSKMIDLKKTEQVFKGNYIINSGTTLTPKIYVWDDTMPSTSLKNIVILSNFDVVAQSIIPNFPTVGTWYNLMDNTIVSVNNVTAPILIEAGGYRIYGNQPASSSGVVAVPIVSDQILCNFATVANLTATGTSIKWYASSAGGSTLDLNAILSTGNYYVTQTIGSKESARLAVSVVINTATTPSFTQVAPICSGEILANLPTISENGITGTWSPTFDNLATTTYTFTPNAGLCAISTTMTIVVNPKVTPIFTQVVPICLGENLADLPTISDNKITGTWSLVLDNLATTTYTFTPTAGLCATSTTMTIVVNPNITPIFTEVAPICSGESLADLPTISENGITGTWSPALDNLATTTYTFTPTAGLCATSTTMAIVVNPNITPTFTQVAPICSGEILADLPTISENGITGSWSPALDNTVTTTYSFTPTAELCATSTAMTIVVNPNITPTFTQVAPICSGENLADLPTVSENGIAGTWSLALDNLATTTYMFTPTAGLCATLTTMTIVVNPNITPTFTQVAPICSGESLADLPTTSNNGVTGSWLPALNNLATTTYTFTPDASLCAASATMTIIVRVSGTISGGDVTVCAPATTLNLNGISTMFTNSTTLNLNDTTPESTVVWQRSTNFVNSNYVTPIWITASNSGMVNNNYVVTPSSLTVSNLTITTWFRAIVTTGSCVNYAIPVKIIVTPQASNSNFTSPAAVCYGGDITFTAPTYIGSSIAWEISTTSPTSGFSVVPNQNGLVFTMINVTYAPPSQFYIRSVVRSGDCSIARSAVKTITVNPISIGGTITGGGNVCSGASGIVKVSGYLGTILLWEYSTDGVSYVPVPALVGTAAATFTSNSISNAAKSYLFTNITGTTYFRFKSSNGICNAAYSNVVQYTLSPAVAGTISGLSTVCSGTGTTLALANAIGTITWQKSTNWTVANSTWTEVLGTTTSLATGNLNVSTAYRAKVTSSTCSTIIATTDNFVVNVTPTAVAGTITTNSVSTFVGGSITYTLSGYVGSAIQWQSLSSASATTGTVVGTGTTYTASNVSGTFLYVRAVVTSGSCSTATTAVKTIAVGPAASGGTITGGGTVCSGASGIVKVSGYVGTVLLWEYSTDGVNYVAVPALVGTAAATFNSNSISNAAKSYLFTIITGNTYFRFKSSFGNGNTAYSNVVQYTIASATAGTATEAASFVCPNAGTTITLVDFIGDVSWQKSINSTAVNPTWTTIAGAASPTLTTGNLTVTTAYRARVTIGTCAPIVQSNVVLVTINCVTNSKEIDDPLEIPEPFSVVIYLNPNHEEFNLNLTSSNEEKVSVLIYDMLGKLIEQRDFKPSEISEMQIGNNFTSGIYNVIINQGQQTKTVRVIKR